MPFTLQNFYKETVKTLWGAGAGNFYVSAKPTPTSGYLVINPSNSLKREIVRYSATGTDGGGDYVTISSVGDRGLGGTTAQTHAVSEPIRMNLTAQHFADMYTDITAKYGPGSVIPNPILPTDVIPRSYVDTIVLLGAALASTSVLGVNTLSASPDISLGTATITIASPAVVSLTSHGLTAGDVVKFTTSGTLPTGITASTNYYVIATGLTANTFQISATYGGTAINTSGSQSGTHTLIEATPVAVSTTDTRLPTQGENDAMVGTSGVPSASNKFVTDADTSGTGPVIRQSAVSTKFGGDGTDGALTVSSGTTNIDVGGVRYFIKNYSSISITGTGKVTFSNPHANGTIIILKSQGATTLTSSQTPMLDASGMGAIGGAAVSRGSAGATNGNDGTDGFGVIWKTNKGLLSTNGAVGLGGAASSSIKTYEEFSQVVKYQDIFVGAGGGSGMVDTAATGSTPAGGRGGGALIIECAGAWNFTTTSGISVAGISPGASTGTGGGGSMGGSGGGGGGYFRALYNVLTATTGTVTISGGTGGNCKWLGSGSSQGAGGGASGKTAGSNGTTSSVDGTKTGGDGALGFSSIGKNYEYA